MSIIITNPFRYLKYCCLGRIPHFKKNSQTDVLKDFYFLHAKKEEEKKQFFDYRLQTHTPKWKKITLLIYIITNIIFSMTSVSA